MRGRDFCAGFDWLLAVGACPSGALLWADQEAGRAPPMPQGSKETACILAQALAHYTRLCPKLMQVRAVEEKLQRFHLRISHVLFYGLIGCKRM